MSDDIKALVEELRRERKKTGGPSSAVDNALEMSKAGLSSAMGVVKTSVDNLKKNVQESADTYQSLSKAGMNFSGDLFAMSNAAVGMRMSTKEMEESFLSFQKDGILKGFGTNLTASAEGFAAASKSFFDNNSMAADSLRRMGFTTKDINEVLAMQGITLRGKFKDDQEMQSVAANNAFKLAQEMDALSKLTGKSRQEQAEMMKKQQADMQFEAAIRLKTQGMSAAEAANFEANARAQLHEANMLGQGQMFKEIFATGQIMTKEAATQAAINRDQAVAAQKMAETAADKTLKAEERDRRAAEARNELMGAAAKDLNDKTKLQAATLGDAGGAYSKVIMDNMGRQIDYSRVLEKVAAERGLDLSKAEDNKKAAQIARDEIKAAAEGQKKTGVDQKEAVDASSKALAAFTGRLGDVQSVINEKFVQPIQKDANKALNDLAETTFRADKNLGNLVKDYQGATTVAQKLKAGLDKGAMSGFKEAQGVVESAGAINQGAREFVPKAVEKVKEVAGAVTEAAQVKPPRRMTGSLGATGSMMENFGPGKLVELHGIEGVMTPKDINDIVKNTMEGAMKAVPKTGLMDTAQLNKLDELKRSVISSGTSKTGGIDLKKMSDTIQTDISSSYSNKVDMKSLKFDQFGMPITSQIREKAAEIPAEVKKKDEEKKTASTSTPTPAAQAPATTAAKPEEKKPDAAKPPAPTGKDSTLNDVVVALNQLNTKVNTLIDVQRDIGQRQIKATKANGKDVYAS
jgi:hypothetical protein